MRLLAVRAPSDETLMIGSAETCSFSDVETGDEHVDAVRWNVRLNLAGDQVEGLSVDRSWPRS